MARGWESKSVEQQQEELAEQRSAIRTTPVSADEQCRNRKRQGLLLSRQRLTQQLTSAVNPTHRQMLEQAVAELNRQLSAL